MGKMVTGVIVFAIIIFSICDAFAAGFSIVGPRALGMGGAFVAVANDSTAVYWNPAGLAKSGRWDIRIPVSLRAQDHLGVADTVDDIDDILAGRDITGPNFQSASGQDAELEPQVRFGIALQPFETLTIALDADITENDTFTPGYSERDIALGLEKTFFYEWVAIRVGGYRNVAESDSNLVGTAGLGLRLILINLDIGAGYDFQKEEALGSLSLAARF